MDKKWAKRTDEPASNSQNLLAFASTGSGPFFIFKKNYFFEILAA
jgi:hypothetical protein